jgi:hypothetical protein
VDTACIVKMNQYSELKEVSDSTVRWSSKLGCLLAMPTFRAEKAMIANGFMSQRRSTQLQLCKLWDSRLRPAHLASSFGPSRMSEVDLRPRTTSGLNSQGRADEIALKE